MLRALVPSSSRRRRALSVIGSLIVGVSFLLYVAASCPWHVYALQAVNGIGTTLRYLSIMNLFTRYIDEGRESFEWGCFSFHNHLFHLLALV